MSIDQTPFESATDAIEYLFNRLPGLDPDLASRIAHQFVEGIKETGPIPGFRMHVERWIIKNEDIDLIATLSPAAITCATAAADPSSVPAVTAAVATTVSVIALMVRRLRNYSIRLTQRQSQLLVILRMLSPDTTIKDLLKHTSLTAAEVEEELRGLTALRTPSGDIRAVVDKDESGRWFLLDV